MNVRLGFVLCVLALSGCGRVQNHHVLTGAPRAASAGDVRVLMENAPVPEGFVEVAIVQSVGSGFKAELAPVISGLKEQAQKLGCNAVVRVRVDQGASLATAVGVAGVLP